MIRTDFPDYYVTNKLALLRSAAYVMNRQSPHLIGDPRAQRLIQALYAAL